jgi:hypothetical protein
VDEADGESTTMTVGGADAELVEVLARSNVRRLMAPAGGGRSQRTDEPGYSVHSAHHAFDSFHNTTTVVGQFGPGIEAVRRSSASRIMPSRSPM